nr:hypothetical protein CFP56_08021 [Quercus suber]
MRKICGGTRLRARAEKALPRCCYKAGHKLLSFTMISQPEVFQGESQALPTCYQHRSQQWQYPKGPDDVFNARCTCIKNSCGSHPRRHGTTVKLSPVFDGLWQKSKAKCRDVGHTVSPTESQSCESLGPVPGKRSGYFLVVPQDGKSCMATFWACLETGTPASSRLVVARLASRKTWQRFSHESIPWSSSNRHDRCAMKTPVSDFVATL